MIDLQPRERCLLEAYLHTGSMDAAARRCGLRPVYARQLLSSLYRRTGVTNIAQAVWRYRDQLAA